MASPYTYEEAVRVHRQAVMNWLGGLHVDYPADEDGVWTQRSNWPILRTFASPDRPFAAISDLLLSQGWFKDKTTADEMRTAASNARDLSVFPLPIVTVQMSDPVQDSAFASAVKEPLRTYNATAGRWERHPWPGHYRTAFTATFWCRKVYTDDHIREWVMSQFGNRGANNNETFIPVVHAEPWGTMMQALRLDGSDDQSALEGNDPRYRRFSYTFNLRTWVMKVTTAEAARVETIIVDEAGNPVAEGDTLADIEPDASNVRYESDNLFNVPFPDQKIATLWPKTGHGQITRGGLMLGGRPGFKIKVDDADDSVDLGEWLTRPEGGVAVFSLWLDYASRAPFVIEAGQRAPADSVRQTVRSVLYPRRLPSSPVHLFVPFTAGLGSFTVAGAGEAATIALTNIHVHRVGNGTHVAATLTAGESKLWDGLLGTPYLMVVLLSAAAPGDVLTIENDAVDPTDVQSVSVSAEDGLVVAILTQPNQASLRLLWSGTTAVATAYVQRYYNSYHGNTV